MPAIENHHDLDAAALERAAQTDPLVMYLVVRHRDAGSLAQLTLAGAQATLACDEWFSDDPDWFQVFGDWREGSFRKVTLRARPSQWEQLLTMDHMADPSGRVLCLPPRAKSSREPLLTKLQAFTASCEELPTGDPVAAQFPVVRYVTREPVVMSAGKLTAQVAHSALMIAATSTTADQDLFQEWKLASWPGELHICDTGTWERLKAEQDCVVVRDAGLTEVDPGTETVLALKPSCEPPPAGLTQIS